MKRDILFAQEVKRQCLKEGYVSITNDGSIHIDELVRKVAVHFGLSGRAKESFCIVIE
ncbi:MAG: hypothetical protein K2N63_03900 [Lachnospiraceae bacterium]|nr:hypothetical protein [Lachnospiraceae bacterium]